MEKKIGRPPKRDYDPEAVMRLLFQTMDEVFDEKQEIKATAMELNLSELKVRKLLITSGKIAYPQTAEITALLREGKTTDQIQKITGLSRASINAYLPYSKVPYKETEVSANADRCNLYRKRKEAIAGVADKESLWQCIVLFQNYPFKTMTGLPFQYNIKKGRNGEYTKELWIDRRGESKSLTMSTVLKAYETAVLLRGTMVSRPKALGDLRGVSYIYSIFYRFGLIDVPDKAKEKMK